MLDELLFGYAVGDHVRDDLLAQVSVRRADHRRLTNRGVREQRLLHLARADPVPAALDQVGGDAADDAV